MLYLPFTTFYDTDNDLYKSLPSGILLITFTTFTTTFFFVVVLLGQKTLIVSPSFGLVARQTDLE